MDMTVDGLAAGAPSVDDGTDALVGRLLDARYRLDRVIARGGMATVYAATDARLDRTVAVKVMRPSLAEDPEFVSRFAREAKAAARLSAAEVVAVHDQGTDAATGTAYLVMEHVAGRTLRDLLLERGALPPGQALALLEPVLRALAAAHAAGLVHRDVKPENVLLADDGRVKVADFGLARAVETSGVTATTGLLIGTVSYLAPEQVEHGVADPRSDVYAAGTLLWELLTGAPPYSSDSPLSVAYMHVHQDVPPPSTVVDGIPPTVDELVVRATRRDPAARPVDAGAFLAELQDVRADLGPVEAPVTPRTTRPTLVVPREDEPAGETVPAGPAPRPRRRLVWLLVLSLLAATALAGGWWFGAGRWTEAPAVLDLAQADAVRALEAAGLEVDLLPGEHSERVAADHVLRQDPGPGTRLLRGSTVELVPSLGPDRRVVPSVLGLDRDAAVAALRAAGLEVGTVTERFSPRDKGTVLEADPPSGERLRPGTPVALVVSKGLEMLPVPDVTGQPRAAAEERLNAAGFKAAVTEVFSTRVAKGRVVGQEPATGRLPRDATVKLTVSKGPEMVTVPDGLVGQPREVAERRLAAAGLRAQVATIPGIPGPGQVLRASPGEGARVPKGSTVTLAVF